MASAQNIVNLNRPLRKHAMRISVGIEYGAPPTRVKDVLLHATANARGISGSQTAGSPEKFWRFRRRVRNQILDLMIIPNIMRFPIRFARTCGTACAAMAFAFPSRPSPSTWNGRRVTSSRKSRALRESCSASSALFKTFNDVQLDFAFTARTGGALWPG